MIRTRSARGTRTRRLLLLAPAGLALALSLARGQDWPPPDDPFLPPPGFPGSEVAGVRSTTVLLSALPPMTIRGLIRVQGRPPAALLEVQGAGVHVLRPGDALLTKLEGGVEVHLKVVGVEERTVTLEAEGLGAVQVR